ncbi:MAG: hypothetical protein RJA19_658 [Bacteroidota bacterium]
MTFAGRHLPMGGRLSGLVMTLLGLLAVGCGTQRPATQPAPTWTQQRPQVPGYYIGVASASKQQYPFDALDMAQKRALSDMAGQISVRVEASSLLETAQRNDQVNEQFSQRIRSSSAEDLAGYELMGSYENKTEAWAYYRLSIATYERIKQERKAAALGVAAGFYHSAEEAVAARDLVTACDRYLRGLEALEPYWGEVNRYQPADGGNAFALDQACLKGLTQVLSGIQLEPLDKELVLNFSSHYRGVVVVQARYDGRVVPNLPLAFRYNRGTLPTRREARTDADGMVQLPVDGFEAGVRHAQVIVSCPWNVLLPDVATRSAWDLVKGIVTPEITVPVRLIQPVIYIESQESLYGRPGAGKRLSDAVAAALTERGMAITHQPAQADATLTISADTRQSGSGQGFYTALLDATLILRDKQGAPVLQRNLERVKGVQTNWDNAAEEAYRKASMEIRGAFLDELLQKLYQ